MVWMDEGWVKWQVDDCTVDTIGGWDTFHG